MKNEQLKNMMNGAFLLSIAAFIVKLLSAVYRVPFQNMVGNTGFYVYQQVYPIYGIGMTFALSGLPVYFSRKIAETDNEFEQLNLVKQSLLILSLFSLLIFGLLYKGAGLLAGLMGDTALTPIIQSVSWMFLFMPLLATIRGYFQGTFRMKPTAVSQISEQLIRVAVILLAAYWFTRSESMNLYQMGSYAMSGAIWGALMASIILLWMFWKDRPRFGKTTENTPVHHSVGVLFRGYLTEGVTICLLTAILVLFQLVDSFTLYKGLVENGVAEGLAKSLKGIYDRGQPLVQLGLVVGTGFSTSFVPLMTRAYLTEQQDEFQRSANSLLRISATFSVAAVAGLLAILPEVNLMLFGDMEGNLVLSVYIISIAAATVMMSYHSILQSMQQYKATLIALAVGLLVKYIGNHYLVVSRGTLGASIATLLGLVVMLLMMHQQLPRSLQTVWRKNHFLVKLASSASLLFIVAFLTKTLLRHYVWLNVTRPLAFLVIMLTVIVAVIFFVWFILRVKLFSIREWLALPMGRKLLKWKRK